MLSYNANELFSAIEIAKNFATIIQKALFEEDKKFVASQVEKIKNGTAKFYSLEETQDQLEGAIQT